MRQGRVGAPTTPVSVCVAQGRNEDTPAQILQAALEGLGGMGRFVQPGQTVAIKPNATWAYPPHTASSSDPEFLTAVIQAVRAAGAGRIIVMDHCSIEPGATQSVPISGIGAVVKAMGVESLFPDRYDAPLSTYTKIDLPYGVANRKIGVIKAAIEADVRINLGVAKSHNVAQLSMCLKHMMGFLQQPGLLHANLDQGIADLSTPSEVQAQLHLLEAIRVRKPQAGAVVCAGPETDLTHPKVVERRNIVLAGVDPVLIDAYGCIHLFGRRPEELRYVLVANQTGCGDIDVDAAVADGRIRLVKTGEVDPGPGASSSVPQPTAVEPSAAMAAEIPATPNAVAPANPSLANQVVGFGPLLNLGLIPVAAILAGAGALILNRMRHKLPRRTPPALHDATGNSPSKNQSDE